MSEKKKKKKQQKIKQTLNRWDLLKFLRFTDPSAVCISGSHFYYREIWKLSCFIFKQKIKK